MEYQRFVLGDLRVNSFLVWSGREAGIIDPGEPAGELLAALEKRDLQLKWIVNTHGHADHIGGNAQLQAATGAPIWIHKEDRPMLTSAEANLSAWLGAPIISPDAAGTLQDGDTLKLGEERLTIIETPGHTPGGISLYFPGLLFSGDALFRESIGRTDFPGGSASKLIQVIKERLFQLPPSTLVWPGHETSTTIEHEIRFNPYFQ
ncbi:glyoxylase-like metal-dependent hydrolase (beta-lactamase superfamily II) [Hydrogenispora ethanolica]|jgi:glyoxylase-like metal-dependent hydrolase (beta-lactamase superfamily II)|uniref:Glyoxylase-like metal-dependent hydrolase (Beta-lactamase superfamily II) n=1 Tax=Hydrogenispora ethanolica TaxID=1082276 RepID=A0A4V2QET8_HYDET|nr:MBL fold metallo-hydrolase [Hydrogenispora ethanolica]TCL69317.1 glyoxylase-like metal-dependent hydrolase (beta-lactamase superfamily II) [Hydrogenispora ethanolica]